MDEMRKQEQSVYAGGPQEERRNLAGLMGQDLNAVVTGVTTGVTTAYLTVKMITKGNDQGPPPPADPPAQR